MLCGLCKAIWKRAPETPIFFPHLCSFEWGQPFLSNIYLCTSYRLDDEGQAVHATLLHVLSSPCLGCVPLASIRKTSVLNPYLGEQGLKGRRTKNFALCSSGALKFPNVLDVVSSWNLFGKTPLMVTEFFLYYLVFIFY